MATKPSYIQTVASLDGLIAGNYVGRSITLKQRAGSIDAEYTLGRLLTRDVDGKYHPITGSPTVIALNATGEVLKNNLAATDLTIPFTLAHPPIPGTVFLGTTADGSATVLKELGIDNGLGNGNGMNGSFTINYQTGQGIAYLNTAATATDDLKAGYSYHTIDPPATGKTATGLPAAVLLESVSGISVSAGDVVTNAAISGTFERSRVLGYSAGYELALNMQRLYTVGTPTPTLTPMIELYVAPTGSNANPGTRAAPFQTLAYAVTQLGPNKTLYLRAGTYAEKLEYPTTIIPSGTDWNAPVTIAAYPGETVIIRPNAGNRVFDFGGTQQYIVLDGLIIDAYNQGIEGVRIAGTAHHIRIQTCEIKNGYIYSVSIESDAHFNKILLTRLHDCGAAGAFPGLQIAGRNNIINGCIVYNCSGHSIYIYNDNPIADDNVIHSCLCYNNGTHFPSISAGIAITRSHNTLVYNNRCYGNPVGILIDFSATGALIYNNTLYDNTASSGNIGLWIGSGSTNAQIINNISYGQGTNILNQGTTTTQTTNLTTDPSFVDAAGHDFHLQPGSAAINTGTLLPEVPEDCEGTRRPQGTAVDIGAFEYVA